MAGCLDGKITLVTGCGSGIGRATALAFAREGAKVVAADVNTAGGEETVQLITAAGGAAAFIKTDVTQACQVQAMTQFAIDTYGRLDCAFNNAGVTTGTDSTADCTQSEWDRVLSINLKGVWLCMKAEIPHILKQDGGAIVNTASVLGLVGIVGQAAYVASKHGVNGLTKTAALEYGKAGIRVNSVCPGVIQTPMVENVIKALPALAEPMRALQPVGRFGNSGEVAEAVVWLCSDAASFVTGHTMAIDGGCVAR